MSRAFIKEGDLEHAGIDFSERPLSEEPNYVTPKGLNLLNTQLDALEIEREQLKQKKDDPIAKQKIAIVERDMRYYAAQIEPAILTAPREEDHAIVLFGAKVTVEDEEASILIVLVADLMAWNKEPSRYWKDAPKPVQDYLVPAIQKYYDGKTEAQRDEAMRSFGMAAMNLMLTAKSMG
ncbi:transcription elongation factor regulatory protein [Methylophilaceae bacterium]